MEHQILIEGGESFAVSTDEDCLLRGALRAGIGMPHECNVGGCGACRFELVVGEMADLWPQAPGLSERDRRRGKRLACQSRPLSDCTLRLRTGEEYRPVVAPRHHTARLEARRELTPDMSLFSFRLPEAAAFRPGQYTLFQLPGVTGVRAYSMSNLPNPEGLLEFVIRRVPGGQGSTALFERVAVGDAVSIDGPYGHAWLRSASESARPVVCIAGGSGLAPMLSVARAAVAFPPSRPVHFFDGVRTVADLCGERELAAGHGAPPGLDYTPVLSEPPADGSWNGATGFVHQTVAARLAAPLDQYEFYFAGPPPMIEAVQTLLTLNHRVPHQQVHFDRFV